MINELNLLILSLFCHIIDDYYLQGCLAQMKQKKFWGNIPKPTKTSYDYDYIVALCMHGFSWATMITVPYIVFCRALEYQYYWVVVLIMAAAHAAVDNAKANDLSINLCTDQLLHIVQLVATWAVLK